MFEVGEKVVCVKMCDSSDNQPKTHEIIRIHSFYNEDGDPLLYLIFEEYFFDSDGEEQCFDSRNFRKLDRQFTEDLLEKITKEAKEEQKILVIVP